MNGTVIKKKLQGILSNTLNNYDVDVKINEDLTYKVIVIENFKFKPNTPRNSDYTFQIDLLITDKNAYNLPLVAIKISNDPSTDHILTYSEKALKHKEIYPYLRYGLIIGGRDDIPNRFFTHNKGFDFAYVLDDINNNNSITGLATMITQQIDSARSLLYILKNENQIKEFNTIVEIK